MSSVLEPTNKQMIMQWLGPDAAERAIANSKKSFLEARADDKISWILSHAFWWQKSPEGAEYWSLVNAKAQARQDGTNN